MAKENKKATPRKESKKEVKKVEKAYETKYYKAPGGARIDNPPEL